MSDYRIERRDGLLIVHGAIPVDDAAALANTLPAESILCTLLPKRLGANFVVGPVAAVNAERERHGIAERVRR